MTTTTATDTIAYLGRCRAKGCKYARRIELETATVTRTRMWGADRHSYEVTVPVVYTNTGHRFELIGRDGRFDRYAYVRAFGSHECPDHQCRMEWKSVSGTHNESVRCDARCTNARRADCECSCAGANHGSAHSVL